MLKLIRTTPKQTRPTPFASEDLSWIWLASNPALELYRAGVPLSDSELLALDPERLLSVRSEEELNHEGEADEGHEICSINDEEDESDTGVSESECGGEVEHGAVELDAGLGPLDCGDSEEETRGEPA